jgi:hypothetical protein
MCCYVAAPASIRRTKQPFPSISGAVEAARAGIDDAEEEQVCCLQQFHILKMQLQYFFFHLFNIAFYNLLRFL